MAVPWSAQGVELALAPLVALLLLDRHSEPEAVGEVHRQVLGKAGLHHGPVAVVAPAILVVSAYGDTMRRRVTNSLISSRLSRTKVRPPLLNGEAVIRYLLSSAHPPDKNIFFSRRRKICCH
jgi:hypothetical protein